MLQTKAVAGVNMQKMTSETTNLLDKARIWVQGEVWGPSASAETEYSAQQVPTVIDMHHRRTNKNLEMNELPYFEER